MRVNIFSYSDKGSNLAVILASLFDDVRCYSTHKSHDDITYVKSSISQVQLEFDNSDLMIFVGATGIAVRSIAPCVKNKTTDPACIVIDECGNFVISLLSGHIGGANDYTHIIADKINAVPVITTATDVNNKFAVDSFAKKNNLAISDMKIAMQISSTILTENVSIEFDDDIIMKNSIGNGLVIDGDNKLGIYVGYKKILPYKTTLNLIPNNLIVGIGCKRGTSSEQIEKLFLAVTKDIDIRAIQSVASIDLKQNEYGLLSFCEKYNLHINFYSAEELNQLEGDFSGSQFVKKITGVDNVCERSAMIYGHKIIKKKTSAAGVTIAIALKQKEVKF
ncbi:MAG: hypothetical protein BEN19_01515 [Epulopiscium sp. Nuni2H_MBin003]|nr:MAG: hypothetical protein BEN19_01515 [Epulopiscium sp. Nuni2H_MBin003]